MSEANKNTAAENKSTDKTNNNATPPSNEPKQGEAWGYDLYPERRGTFSAKLGNILIGKEGKENIDKFKCEKNVYECVKESKYLHYVIKVTDWE